MADKIGASFLLNKLVRDGIAADMIARGEKPELTQLQGVDLLHALIKKIQEEASELDPMSEDLLKELGDISEAIRQTVILRGWHTDDVERTRQARYEKMGGFDGGQYVGRLDLPAGDPWIDYYRQDPARFHELKNKWPTLPGQ